MNSKIVVKKILKLRNIIAILIIVFSGCKEKDDPSAPTKPSDLVVVNPAEKYQLIRGFGGMNFPRWQPDLTTEEVDKVFGNDEGQLGLTILRISISPDKNDWSRELPTAQKAKNHGAIILGAPWSPPASMKTNNSTIKGELKVDSYVDYASYLSDFASYMSSKNAELYAVSVQNEPDWLPEYESCGWSSAQMKSFLKNNASIIPTKIVTPEIVHFKQSYIDDIMNDAAAAEQVDIVATHLYGGEITPYSNPGIEYWMTEHYTDSDHSANEWPLALDVAEEIHDCMTIGLFNAYIWWYLKRYYGPVDEDGTITKRGYILGQFAKFVRPGATRIAATPNPKTGLFVSAYQGDKLIVIATNKSVYKRNLTFSFSNVTSLTSATPYTTSYDKNITVGEVVPVNNNQFDFEVEAESITTFIVE